MSRIYLDTETIPAQEPAIIDAVLGAVRAACQADIDAVQAPGNYKDPAKIAEYIDAKRSELAACLDAKVEEAWRDTALEPAFGQLAVVSIAVDDGEPFAIYDSAWDEAGYEHWLLNEVNARLQAICGHHRGHQLIGFNTPFDRGFLRKRGIVRRVRMHQLITMMVKPWEDNVIVDVMTQWTGDVRDRIKMDKLCQALGIDGKGNDTDEHIDGSMVWDFVQAGKIDKVALYCNGDVQRTRALHRRINFFDAAAPVVIEDAPF
jgi:hypothetical protein